ncbi:MAG: hypothetical protein GY786_09025 [Proteobacteria bacterium]|nr:hypothetical protein [Pseudomonadota bacterium]
MDEKDAKVWSAIRSKLLIDKELEDEWNQTKDDYSFKNFEEYVDLRIIPIMKEQVKTREKEGYRFSMDG